MEDELIKLREEVLRLRALRDSKIKSVDEEELVKENDLTTVLQERISKLEEEAKRVEAELKKLAKEIEEKQARINKAEEERIKAYEESKLLSKEEINEIRENSTDSQLTAYYEYN